MLNEHSLLEINLARRSEQIELAKLFTPAPPWPEQQRSAQAIAKRRAAADKYEEFDRLYFPPEAYGDQYAPSNAFHAHVAACCLERDRRVSVIVGPHDHAKSATVYKVLIWLALFGKKHFIGIASETLETPRNLLTALSHYLHSNARILHDFPDLEFLSDSQERLHLRTNSNPRGTVFQGYSEEKSTRGKNADLFFRFDLLVVEDLENRNSSLTKAAVEKREQRLAEFQSSLAESGCMVVTANNFDERCVINQLVTRQSKGQLDSSWTVWVFPAWGKYYDANGRFVLRDASHTATTLSEGPLWRERYPAVSEAELRAMLRPFDDATWSGSYQGRPQKPSGDFFPRANVCVWTTLPDDLDGVLNSDQNLARKGKGDRTFMGILAYSASTNKLYVIDPRYHSYTNSNDTLDDMRRTLALAFDEGVNVVAVGMEGHVNQESHWQQHVENYMAINGVLFPPILFHRYQIQIESKQAQLYWINNQILWPADWVESDEGAAALDHTCSFTGIKLAGARDDAPDWLIKSVKLLLELYVLVETGTPGISAPGGTLTRTGRLNLGRRIGRM